MVKKNNTPTTLLALAAQWSVLAKLAIVFAQQISMMKKMRSRSGAARAEMLEAWLYMAVTKLAADISVYAGNDARLNSEETRALEHMKVLYMTLSMLLLIVGEMRRGIEMLGAGCEYFGELQSARKAGKPQRIVRAVALIDTS